MKNGRKSFPLGLVLLIIAGILLALYFFVSGSESLQTLVLQQIDRMFGQKIRVSRIEASFFPHPQIRLSDVTMSGEEGGLPFFRASRIVLNIGVFPLLADQIVPKQLVITGAEVFVRREEDRQWVIPFQNGKAIGSPAWWNGLFLIPTISIVQGRLILEDDFHPKGHRNLVFDMVNLEIEKNVRPSDYELTLSGQLHHQAHVSVISLYSRLELLSLLTDSSKSSFSSLLDPLKITGRIQMEELDLTILDTLFSEEEFPFAVYGNTDVQGEFHMVPGLHGYDLALTNVVVKGEPVTLRGNANVSALMTEEPPTVFITLASSPFQLSTLTSLVPSDLIPAPLSSAITRKTIGGVIEVLSANLAGSPRPDVGFSLVGDIQVHDAFIELGERWGKAHNISGRIFLRPDQVRISEARGLYDSIPVHSARGTIDLQHEDMWFETVLQGDVPAERVIGIVQEIFRPDLGDNPILKAKGVSGGGLMTIRFAGPLNNPTEIGFQNAVYSIGNTVIHVPGWGSNFSNIQGQMNFSQKHIGFDQVTGIWGTSRWGLTGNLRFDGPNQFESFHVQGMFDVGEVLSVVNHWHPIKRIIQGAANVAASLSGSFRSPSIQGKVGLHRIGLIIPNFFYKARGIPGSLEFEGRLYPTGEMLLKRLDLSVLPIQVSGRGTFSLADDMVLDSSLSTNQIDLGVVPEGVVLGDGAVKEGILEMSLNVTGRGTDWRQWKKNGWVALTDGVLEKKGLDEKVTDLFLRLKINESIAELKRLEFQIQDSRARATGTIRNWDAQPEVTFDVVAPQFDLDLLIPKGERSLIRDILETIADKYQVQGTVQFQKSWYKHLTFSSLSGEVQIHNAFVGVDNIQGDLEPGALTGRLLVHLPKDRPAAVKTWIDLEEMPLKPLFQTFTDESLQQERLITGTLALQGTVQGHGRDEEGVFPTLKGDVEMKITDGRILRGTIVPKILGILNLPLMLQGKVDFSKDGYPFDTQTATIHLENGMMTSDNVVLDGPLLKMTAAGSYDMVHDQLEVMTAVSPFGSYSDLLKKIPLFGLLLEGEREAIDTALFEVKGSLHDPDVSYRPLQSFQAGLTGFAKLAINVLKNTFTLPTKLMTPSKESTSSSPSRDGEP